jgi:hypothetical protein
MEKRFPKALQEFLHEWATANVPKNWEEQTSAKPEGGPWLASEDIGSLARYIRDFLCSPAAAEEVNRQLLKVVGLKLRDESAKRRARRKYIQIMLNDYVMNPGPPPEAPSPDEMEKDQDFGLMAPFVTRWRTKLPEILALGAGAEIHIPPGNAQLIEIHATYKK